MVNNAHLSEYNPKNDNRHLSEYNPIINRHTSTAQAAHAHTATTHKSGGHKIKVHHQTQV